MFRMPATMITFLIKHLNNKKFFGKMERTLFGTDGIRGKANRFPMTAELALRLGQAAALKLNNGADKLKVVIGKDTRRSGYIFEFALTSGLCSMGADVYLVGPMPTPAIAHLVRSFAADFGIVISASHNPAEDNGIKFFDSKGYKLPDAVELEIESVVLSGHFDAVCLKHELLGKAHRIEDSHGRYIEYAKGSISNTSLEGLHIVMDCANGAAYKVAPLIFSELGAKVSPIHNQPDGLNINQDCGALHPDKLSQQVLKSGADLGIALDGDADRLLMVDEKGVVLDGDELMAIAALSLKEKGLLKGNLVIGTVMSNLGFEKALADNGIALKRTKVGDRYVIEEMVRSGAILGGEQSGHIIFGDYNSTGDGTIAALQIVRIMKDRGKKLSELRAGMKLYPQETQNVIVREKKPLETLKLLPAAVKAAEESLKETGRVLVRYSGTENKLRIMVEAESRSSMKENLDMLVKAAKEELG
jgi:phosphoglucosamine mutase